MEKEDNKNQPLETEISFESLSSTGENSPREFIEPLNEIEDPADGEEEIDLDPMMDDEGPMDNEDEDQAPFQDTVPDADELSGRDAAEDALAGSDGLSATEEDDNDGAKSADESPEHSSKNIESDEINSPDTEISEADVSDASEEETELNAPDDSVEAQANSATEETVAAPARGKKENFKKLALAVIFTCGLTIVLLAYGDRLPFSKKDTTRQTVVSAVDPDPAQAVDPEPEPERIDAYTPYRSKLREAAALRESILMKRQEIQGLQDHYRKGIEKLENDILVEVLDYNLKEYEKAIKNKRVELSLQTIQRRRAYIDQLDDPMQWLEQGSEELLYLKRRAAFDLQLIGIAGGIDMKMHMRHINAAIQKYQLTAENLAIAPDAARMEPLGKIWERLYAKTENNPMLRKDLDNWYIQQEICSGDLARVGELSQITIETARCLSKIEASDLFLNNISKLSPSAARYLCQWDGKWLCLNGVTALSPTVADYLFQWDGEWISLNGLAEFPPELAKHLVQWQGKQLELMGLDDNKVLPDKATLDYFVQWEKAGGKLFVPPNIRILMNQL